MHIQCSISLLLNRLTHPSLQFASRMPDRNDKLYFLWSSLFFATFYLPLWTPPFPHLLLSYRLIIPPPQVPSGPRDTLSLTLFQTTHRNGIKSTCQNVFHLIYLTLLYDTQDLLSGVVEPSDAVLLNLRDGQTRSRGAVTCPPHGRRRCPHNAAQDGDIYWPWRDRTVWTEKIKKHKVELQLIATPHK